MPDAPSPERESTWRAGYALLAVVVAIQAASLWTIQFFPTQDGPSHQALAALERQFDRPEGAFLHEYFERNPRHVPNAFVSFLMDDVLRAVPVPLAERIVLTLYVLLLPAAMLYALRAIEPRAGPMALLVTPFTFNVPFQTGFFNFSFGLAAAFFAIGYWLKHQDRMYGWRAGAFAALTLWVYFCHAVAFGLVAAVTVAIALWRLVTDGRSRLAPLLLTIAALAPALGLLLVFWADHPPGTVEFLTLREKARDFLALRSLEVMSMETRPFCKATAGLWALALGAALAFRVRSVMALFAGGWLLVVLGLIAAYFAVPNSFSGGGYFASRFMLFPYVCAIPALATLRVSRRFQMAVAPLAAALALALLACYWPAWRHLDGYLEEYVSAADRIEPGRTLLAVSYQRMAAAPTGEMLDYRSDPFLHASGYVAARRPVVDLNLYEASSTVFSMTYRDDKSPYKFFRGLEWQSPVVDVLAYPKKTGGRIDYVLLWRASADDARARAVLDQLDAAYERVFVSARGLAVLYRLR